MKKEVILIIVAVIWFIVGGIYFSYKPNLVDWISTLFIYLVGFHWIYAFTFEKTMHVLNVSIPPNSSGKNNNLKRLIALLLGVVLFVFSSATKLTI
jgi:hypothetical protein